LCNQQSTNVWVENAGRPRLDVAKIPEVARDCVHPVLNSDPGVLAMLGSNSLDSTEKLIRYTRLETRSRLDLWPGMVASVGNHSAVPVPGRPSHSRDNTKSRPAYVVLTEEWPFGPCPERGLRIASVKSEINLAVIGTFANADSVLENCLAQPKVPGAKIRLMMHAHNPTVFKNVIFVGWLGHGLRALDISNPFNPREVGHARPIPWGDVMTYPDFDRGLIYIGDNQSGLHVLKYTGPRAYELPQETYSSNRLSPH